MAASDLVRIHIAMEELEKKGYEISEGKWCCSTCTTADFDTNKFVYYHEQDAERLNASQCIPRGDTFYIGWGEDGNLKEICDAFKKQEFKVIKPKSAATRIGLQ
jgi:hypothetical protein